MRTQKDRDLLSAPARKPEHVLVRPLPPSPSRVTRRLELTEASPIKQLFPSTGTPPLPELPREASDGDRSKEAPRPKDERRSRDEGRVVVEGRGEGGWSNWGTPEGVVIG